MDETKRTIAAVVAVIVIIGSLSSILYHRLHKPPVEDNGAKAYEGMGEVVAGEAAAAMGGKGTVVVIGASAPVAQAFERGASAKPGVAVKPVASSGKISSTEEIETLVKNGGGEGAVIFEDAVDLQKLRASAPGTAPTVVLVTGDYASAKELLEKKLIRTAIVPRTRPPKSTEPPKTSQEWFDNFYEVITESDAGQLPVPRH